MGWLKVAVRRFTDGLAVLGGADMLILPKARSTKPGFVGLSLVMLSTAVVATISMAFALTGPLRAPLKYAIPLAIGWGCIILAIDRYLIKSMQGISGWIQILCMAVPRLLMAAVIGVVVSTPITLRIFEPEINAQLMTVNQDAAVEAQSALKTEQVWTNLQDTKKKIADQEAIMDGKKENQFTPGLQAATESLDSATAKQDRLKEESDELFLKRQCEEKGMGNTEQCKGKSSSEVGQGPRWEQFDKQYRDKLRELETAEADVSRAQAKVDSERTAAAIQSEGSLQQSKLEAWRQLCGTEDFDQCPGGLRAIEKEQQQKVDDREKELTEAKLGNNGIMAQLKALNDLAKDTREGKLAHWAIMLFFFMIEIMPVVIKTLVAFGKNHQYDEVLERMEAYELVAARSAYDWDSMRISNSETKRAAIEKDMLDREIALGKKANDQVAREMDAILQQALDQWTQGLHQTMAANPPKPPNSAPPSNLPTFPPSNQMPTSLPDPLGLNAKGTKI